MKSANLSERLTFYARATIDDGAGNVRGEWVRRFGRWAEIRLRPTSESFQQARIQGRVPADVRVRRDPETEAIGTDWMAEDARGVRFNIAQPMVDPADRGMIVFTMIAGEALG